MLPLNAIEVTTQMPIGAIVGGHLQLYSEGGLRNRPALPSFRPPVPQKRPLRSSICPALLSCAHMGHHTSHYRVFLANRNGGWRVLHKITANQTQMLKTAYSRLSTIYQHEVIGFPSTSITPPKRAYQMCCCTSVST